MSHPGKRARHRAKHALSPSAIEPPLLHESVHGLSFSQEHPLACHFVHTAFAQAIDAWVHAPLAQRSSDVRHACLHSPARAAHSRRHASSLHAILQVSHPTPHFESHDVQVLVQAERQSSCLPLHGSYAHDWE
jgi:hypothetical protein